MARENAAGKARRYLTEGRVIVQAVRPGAVAATVRGDGRVYACAFLADSWACSCPALTDQCAHLIAVRLVTAVDLNP